MIETYHRAKYMCMGLCLLNHLMDIIKKRYFIFNYTRQMHYIYTADCNTAAIYSLFWRWIYSFHTWRQVNGVSTLLQFINTPGFMLTFSCVQNS